ETVHPEKPVEFFGPESSRFTESQLLGKRVHLEFEPEDRYDRYGRMLAYVFVENGTLFNAELVKKGFARVIAPSPFRYYKEFKQYERQARKGGVGIWSKQ
ncbi:thermonuclease family protein, partial [Desulfobacterota bacterium AH_259_B03_O07]|nr:thermonuclease family protein [Desulfobacterota bacterium AH_259_B03_O07]